MVAQSRTLLASRTAMFLSGLLLGMTQCHANTMAVACSEGVSAPCLDADRGNSALSLLQNRAAAKRIVPEPNGPNTKGIVLELNETERKAQQQQRLEHAKPIVWVHVPRCGVTFVNALSQHPGICPGALPENAIVNQDGPEMMLFHQKLNIEKACPLSFVDPEHLLGWHDGIGTSYHWTKLEGHLMTVLRHPKSRLISAYNYGMHSWPTANRDNVSLIEYVDMMQGHFLKTLVRDYSAADELEDQYHVFHDTVTVKEVQEATRRLHLGFAFIGILEEWPLSMCLFHKMFGGQCVKSEFPHIHDGRGEAEAEDLNHVQQMKELEGFEDPYDTPLYEQALARFQAELLSFEVSAETCQECWAAAGYDPEHKEDV